MKTIEFKTFGGATYTIVKPQSMADIKSEPDIRPAEDAKKFNDRHKHTNSIGEDDNEKGSSS